MLPELPGKAACELAMLRTYVYVTQTASSLRERNIVEEGLLSSAAESCACLCQVAVVTGMQYNVSMSSIQKFKVKLPLILQAWAPHVLRAKHGTYHSNSQ